MNNANICGNMNWHGKSSKGMFSYLMSVLIAVVVAIALVAVMKKAFIKAFLNVYEDPEFQARMISLAVSRMIFMPEGTKLYYTLPESNDCEIKIGNGLVFANISGRVAYKPFVSLTCNTTVPAEIECDGSTIVFEKLNGLVVAHKQGERIEVKPKC